MTQIDYSEINERAFDILSKSYKKRRNANKQHFEDTTKLFIDYLLINFSAYSVLEIGHGSGIALSIFEKKGIKTTAIDISDEMIRLASKLSPKTEYIHNDFLEYDFQNKIFQGVFVKQVFHLFPSDRAEEFLKKLL